MERDCLTCPLWPRTTSSRTREGGFPTTKDEGKRERYGKFSEKEVRGPGRSQLCCH